jgi:sorting nexin-9/18/33
MVASPKKESKLKGLKSFIAYQLTPTVSNIDTALSVVFVQQ